MTSRSHRWLSVALFLALLLLLSGCVAVPVPAQPAGAPQIGADVTPPVSPIGQADDVARFKTSLAAQGFTVADAKIAEFDIPAVCCTKDRTLWPFSCLANNAGAPYKAAIVPDAPDQEVPDAAPFTFRLAANEAIVLVGQTPPPVDYFSYQAFLVMRDAANIRRTANPGETSLGFLSAAVGDTVNNLTIHTLGDPADPYNKDAIVILTSDAGVLAKLKAAAEETGYPEGIINLVTLPSAVSYQGTDKQADQFTLFHRMFRPRKGSEQAFEQYLATPQVALRVTLPGAQPDPLPVETLRVRGTGKTEMDLMPAVEDLRKAILAKHQDLEATELSTEVWLHDGFDGLQREINTYGPTRDTIYLRTDSFKLPAGPDDFVIVYGTNHEATGKATYANAGVYAGNDYVGADLILGLVSEQSGVYQGSATDYLPADHPEAEKLYAWKFARHCNGEEHCTEVALSSCERLDLDGLPDLWMAFRMYLEQATKVGPDFSEVIYDRAILFHAK